MITRLSVSSLIAAFGLVALIGCSGDPDPVDTSARISGQYEFDSPVNGPTRTDNEMDDAGGVQNDSAAPGESATPERLVEESDIWKLDGTTMYVLNRYRGLQVIDVSDLDAPKLIGRAPIYGWPREMYVRDGKAYVIVSDYYSYWYDADGSTAPGSWRGSQLRIVDLSDLTKPTVEGSINIDGDVTDSRIVGDVMYLVSRRFAWYWRYDTDDTESKTTILSVDVSDPANVTAVDSKSFPMGNSGWEQHISVSQHAVYVATPEWQQTGSRTRIRYVDISDPAGAIVTRGEAIIPGRVQDRWAMDEFNGALRVASGESWGNGDVHLTTWDAAHPDTFAKLGSYTLRINENLTSARFDGERGYLVSYRNIDPLFSFDLSDATKPKLLGELEMTGWLDFMIPFGNRIVALGHEDITGSNGSRSVSLAVSLVDVAGDTPELLSRVVVGDGWGWVPGERDDFAKVFKVLPHENLVVFPFQSWSQTDWSYVGGVQLIDWKDDKLVERGLARADGWVERAIPYQESTLLTISQDAFQVLDIADRDAPKLRGELELARNVQQFALLGEDHAVQMTGDWYRGDTRLTVTPLSDPDTASPVASVQVPAPYGRMWMNGSFAYVAGVRGDGPRNEQSTRVDVIDLSKPATPLQRGHVTLPEVVQPGGGYWGWGYGDEVAQVGASTLAFHRYAYDYCYEDAGCGSKEDHKIQLVDLSDPDAPVVAASVAFASADWTWGLQARGSTLYLSEYRRFKRAGNWRARYYLRRVDVSDPKAPVALAPVNIPGYFVGASPDGSHVYTAESWWDSSSQRSKSRLYALELVDDRAYLRGWTDLEGSFGSMQQDGTTLWTSAYWNENTSGQDDDDSSVSSSDDYGAWVNHSQLVSISFADPAAPVVSGRAELPVSWGWLLKVENGRAFFSGGPGLFTYDVRDSAKPFFEGFHRTQNSIQDVVTKGDKAWLPSGYFGVQSIDLPASGGR